MIMQREIIVDSLNFLKKLSESLISEKGFITSRNLIGLIEKMDYPKDSEKFFQLLINVGHVSELPLEQGFIIYYLDSRQQDYLSQFKDYT